MHRWGQHAAMCSSSPLEVTAMIFDIRYLTVLFFVLGALEMARGKKQD